jgi:hypothetical protein
VSFSTGIVFLDPDGKGYNGPVRAVRGGSPSGAFLDAIQGVLD